MGLKKPTIGVIGGMGTLAGLMACQTIARMTGAASDQEHCSMFLISDSSVADRTQSVISGDRDIVTQLKKLLERSAVHEPDYIIIACNTAHAFLAELEAESPAPIISLIDSAVSAVAGRFSVGSKIGVIATKGTLEKQLYQRALKGVGMRAIIPNKNLVANSVMPAIYDYLKAGRDFDQAKKILDSVIGDLISRGAECVILGCSELSLIYSETGVLIDPVAAAAREAVNAPLPVAVR